MLADLYHAHHNLHPEDLPFWIELAMQSVEPILELGCGTGRVLIPVAHARQAAGIGFDRAYGLDHNYGMLSRLRRQMLAEKLAEVRVIQADFTQFRLAKKFGLVMMPCNTYSTLGMNGRRRVLECVAAHLAPGGVFAASLPNPKMLQALPARSHVQVEEVFPHPLDGEPVQVSSGWQRSRDLFRITWHYDHLLPDGGVERITTHVEHSLTSPETYIQEAASAGFATPRLLGDYDWSAYQPDAPYLIFIAASNQK